MTDLIDRIDGGSLADLEELDRPVPSRPRPPERSAGRRFAPIGVCLALLLACNAILLMANAAHLHGWRADTALVLAWGGLALGVGCAVKATRAVLGVSLALSGCALALWIATRTVAAVPSAVTWVGIVLATLGFLAALLALARPDLGTRWSAPTLVLSSAVPVAIAIITTSALLATPTATPSTPAPRAPKSFASTSAELAIKTTVPVPGQSSKLFQRVLAGNASEQSELKPFVPLGPADQAVLSQQLTQAFLAAEKFPTVASAKAAGMILAGGMAPGVGAHYQIVGASDLTSLDGRFDPSAPASWIYASTADNAPVVGVMYESLTAQPPAGFVGPNDHWHRHANVCVKFDAGEIAVPFAADQNVTPQECADVHGLFMKKTVWMVHAWVVPGWESPQGVFSHDNLHVYCPGNTDLVDAIGFCNRQQ
jgi:hypothetical protein